MWIKCELCNKKIWQKPSHFNKRTHHYCSPECSQKGRKGFKHSEKSKKQMSKSWWNFPFRQTLIKKSSLLMKGNTYRLGKLKIKINNCKCKICLKEFYIPKCHIKRGQGKYCSMMCYLKKINRGFLKGNQWYKKVKHLKGKFNPNWQGGKYKKKTGYVLINQPNHPFACSGRVLEHRLIMERKIGRYLHTWEVVHHINRIRNDNRIENLQLFSNDAEHQKKGHIDK